MREKITLTSDLVAKVERKIPQDHLAADPNRVPMLDEDFAAVVAGSFLALLADHATNSCQYKCLSDHAFQVSGLLSDDIGRVANLGAMVTMDALYTWRIPDF